MDHVFIGFPMKLAVWKDQLFIIFVLNQIVHNRSNKRSKEKK